MTFAIGLKVLRRLCEEQKLAAWSKAKLNDSLFTVAELPAFHWVAAHVKAYHTLPQLDTLVQQFPDVKTLSTPEPTAYYVTLLENLNFLEKINRANLESQAVLKDDSAGYAKAMAILQKALKEIQAQKQRAQVLDVGADAAGMVLQQYHTQALGEPAALFGWPYMDSGSPLISGDLVSFVGRPATGKTYLSLWTAIKNWQNGTNVLFVSMEMMLLPVAQRIAAMYTHLPITQLKKAQFATPTLQKFGERIQLMENEKGKLYIMDGRLAAGAMEIYDLADQLGCTVIIIDGAYLVKHPDKRLNKFARVDANVELFKQNTMDMDNTTTIASWQFSREQSKKSKKSGKQETDLEDIGLSDTIGQVSSVVLAFTQEEGIETLTRRRIRLMKGREGEVGQFSISWLFNTMDFDQVDPPLSGEAESVEEYQYI